MTKEGEEPGGRRGRRKDPRSEPAESGRRTGRPSRLTPELITHIVQRVEAGARPEAAAGAAGVARSTFFSWMRTGREEITRREEGLSPRHSLDLHVALVTTTDEAGDRLEVMLIVELRSSLRGKPKAIIESLDRLRPGWDRPAEAAPREVGLDGVFNQIWEEARRRRAGKAQSGRAEEDPKEENGGWE